MRQRWPIRAVPNDTGCVHHRPLTGSPSPWSCGWALLPSCWAKGLDEAPTPPSRPLQPPLPVSAVFPLRCFASARAGFADRFIDGCAALPAPLAPAAKREMVPKSRCRRSPREDPRSPPLCSQGRIPMGCSPLGADLRATRLPLQRRRPNPPIPTACPNARVPFPGAGASKIDVEDAERLREAAGKGCCDAPARFGKSSLQQATGLWPLCCRETWRIFCGFINLNFK